MVGDAAEPDIADGSSRERGLGATLADIDEDTLLAVILALLRTDRSDRPHSPAAVEVGPGDDAAVLRFGGDLVATTDAMVGFQDWRDEWSTGRDVGHKVVVQNLADVAAMGAEPIGLLVTVAASPQTSTDWVLDLARGLGEAAAAAGCAVVGGDLSAAQPGTVVVSVTALGDLRGRAPVLRSGARPGDVVAVCGTLGLSGAGLDLLRAGRPQADEEAVRRHLRPVSPLANGVSAAGVATSMIDISDGLLRDAHRVARASGVWLDLTSTGLAGDVDRLAPTLGAAAALDCVLTGGEEHSLIATFPSEGAATECGFRVIGSVRAGGQADAEGGTEPADGEPRAPDRGRVPEQPWRAGRTGVTLDAVPQPPRGWDHFGGTDPDADNSGG